MEWDQFRLSNGRCQYLSPADRFYLTINLQELQPIAHATLSGWLRGSFSGSRFARYLHLNAVIFHVLAFILYGSWHCFTRRKKKKTIKTQPKRKTGQNISSCALALELYAIITHSRSFLHVMVIKCKQAKYSCSSNTACFISKIKMSQRETLM